jgi:hypothetical protein
MYVGCMTAGARHCNIDRKEADLGDKTLLLGPPPGVEHKVQTCGGAEQCDSHPLTPFAFKDEFVPGNGKNRP